MARIERLVAEMRKNPANVRFSDLVRVCDHYFGDARQTGSSHRIYKTPWQGDPREHSGKPRWEGEGVSGTAGSRCHRPDRKQMMMVNYEHYTYRVTWSEEDGEYVGLCAEFPSLSYLDEKRAAALEGIVDVVRQVVADMAENGEAVPEPLADKTYSGKFQVRIPPHQHRMLAIQAAEEGVSLNRYISAKLT